LLPFGDWRVTRGRTPTPLGRGSALLTAAGSPPPPSPAALASRVLPPSPGLSQRPAGSSPQTRTMVAANQDRAPEPRTRSGRCDRLGARSAARRATNPTGVVSSAPPARMDNQRHKWTCPSCSTTWHTCPASRVRRAAPMPTCSTRRPARTPAPPRARNRGMPDLPRAGAVSRVADVAGPRLTTVWCRGRRGCASAAPTRRSSVTGWETGAGRHPRHRRHSRHRWWGWRSQKVRVHLYSCR